MRLLKSFIIIPSIALIIFTIFIAVLIATLDSDDYRDILTWSADHFTDYTVTMHRPFSFDLFSMQPALSASGIQIEPDEKGVQPLTAHIGRIRLKLALKPLLAGELLFRELLVEDAAVSYITKEDLPVNDDEARRSGRKSDGPDIPLLEKASLKNVNISYVNKSTDFSLEVNIRSLGIDHEHDAETMHIRGEGNINDTDVVISGLVQGGTLAHPEINNTDLKLHISGKNTKALKLLLYDWLPDTGPVIGEAQITGPIKGLALEGLTVNAGTPETAMVNVKGRLGRIPIGSVEPLSDIDLSLDIESHKPKVLFSGLDMTLPELSSVSGSTRMHGSGDKLRFDGITIESSEQEGVKLALSGSAVLEQRKDKAPLVLL